MQNIIWLIYIGLWLAAARFATRARVSVPRVIEVSGLIYVPNQWAMGCMTALFFVLGGGIGLAEPTAIRDILSMSPTSGSWPSGALNGLGRIAQIVGGLCGAYVGVRTVRLWIVLLLAWMALQVLIYAFHYVVHGS